jgi:hypothetical protein
MSNTKNYFKTTARLIAYLPDVTCIRDESGDAHKRANSIHDLNLESSMDN